MACCTTSTVKLRAAPNKMASWGNSRNGRGFGKPLLCMTFSIFMMSLSQCPYNIILILLGERRGKLYADGDVAQNL